MTLGERVEAIRASAPAQERISRPELAKRLKLDRSTVTKWATGHGSPRNPEAVAAVLGVTVAELYAGQRDERSRRRARKVA